MTPIKEVTEYDFFLKKRKRKQDFRQNRTGKIIQLWPTMTSQLLNNRNLVLYLDNTLFGLDSKIHDYDL